VRRCGSTARREHERVLAPRLEGRGTAPQRGGADGACARGGRDPTAAAKVLALRLDSLVKKATLAQAAAAESSAIGWRSKSRRGPSKLRRVYFVTRELAGARGVEGVGAGGVDAVVVSARDRGGDAVGVAVAAPSASKQPR
jgi:hypothetical protein